ncbi:hypothetical protein WICPIJ_009141 [Wickerhamomyces pijperi]|uniref:Uncharacterized protein n=1 Tax=Wickerhamomyces pijperi TaxID=599730 RepID=A0A9P8PQG1_WICPI|nr:hypothetical protein WICPIJ_009141 [Wickerhamomyces pijperi]
MRSCSKIESFWSLASTLLISSSTTSFNSSADSSLLLSLAFSLLNSSIPSKSNKVSWSVHVLFVISLNLSNLMKSEAWKLALNWPSLNTLEETEALDLRLWYLTSVESLPVILQVKFLVLALTVSFSCSFKATASCEES